VNILNSQDCSALILAGLFPGWFSTPEITFSKKLHVITKENYLDESLY
jgi:hypothetical protein